MVQEYQECFDTLLLWVTSHSKVLAQEIPNKILQCLDVSKSQLHMSKVSMRDVLQLSTNISASSVPGCFLLNHPGWTFHT